MMRCSVGAQAIQQLTKLAPATALLLKLDGAGAVADEQEVPIALVQRGDRLKVITTSARQTGSTLLVDNTPSFVLVEE